MGVCHAEFNFIAPVFGGTFFKQFISVAWPGCFGPAEKP